MKIEIELPGVVTPSGNQIKRWLYKGQTWRLSKLKELYRPILSICSVHYKAEEGERRRVEFHSHRKRKIDDDNLIDGFKYLRDMLRVVGLIWEDSPKYLEAEYFQYTDRKNVKTRLIIESMEEE